MSNVIKPFEIFRVSVPDGEYSRRADVVEKLHYDTAQSQLAALREELAEKSEELSAVLGREALTEQSLAELVGLLRSVWECSEVKGDEWKRIDFYLNPNQEASSHD